MKWYELDRTSKGELCFVEWEGEPPVEVYIDEYNKIEWVENCETWGVDEYMGVYIFLIGGETYALDPRE